MSVVFAVTISLLFITNNLSAQTIVETFEDASWTAISANSLSLNSTTVGVASSTPTTSNQTITSWNETTGGTTTTTTASASMSSVWTWGMSGVLNQSQGYSTCDVVPHSCTHSAILTAYDGYIVSPIVSGGISQVTFWIADYDAQGAAVWMGLNTNVTGTNSTYYPTTASLNTYTSTLTGGVFAHFLAAPTSSMTVCYATLGSANAQIAIQCTYNVTGTLSTVPAQFVIYCNGTTASLNNRIAVDDIVINPFVCVPYTWTGAVDSNWSVAGNWTCGTLPGAANDVIIPAVARLPILSANTTIHSIALNSGATVGLNAHTFTINGTPTGTGTYTGSSTSSMSFGGSSSGTVYFTSTSTSTKTLQNLTLADGANITIGNALNIASTGTVSVGTPAGAGATLASGGNITLLSDDNGWARVAQVPTSSGTSLSTISGSVNVQCYIHSVNSSVSTARRAWRLLTAPVTNKSMGTATTIYNSWQNGGVFTSGVGTMITAPASVATGGSGNGMDYGINANYSMYTWNVATQKLVATANTKTTNISTANGSADNIPYFIFVRGDRTPNTVNLPWLATINNTTLSATGILQLGDQTFSSGSSLTHNQIFLVGNPYACSVNFKKIAGDTATFTSGLTNLINRIYVWNSNLTGTQKVGGYVCIDDATNSGTYTDYLNSRAGTNLGTASFPDLNIQSGQAFFLQDSTAGVCSIKFTEATKTNTNNYIYRPEDVQANSTPIDMVVGTLSLLNSDSTTSLTDGVVAQFKSNFCDCVDNMDAPKFSNIDEMFSLARYGNQLSIERRPEVVSTDTLYLNLKQMAQRPYQFGFTLRLPNHPGLGARLEDDYLGTKKALNMNGSDTANFTMDANVASQDTGRFKIVFGAVNIAPVYTTIKATQEANTVLVQWTVSNDQQMTGYVLQKSTDGINYVDVYTTTALHTAGAAYSWLDTNPVAGTNYYRVLSTNELNEESYSSVVSVIIPTLGSRGITVYPNPIQNGIIGLAFNNMPQGSYRYRLLDDIGQELQTGTVDHPGGNSTTTIPINKLIANGAYQLEIFAPDNSRTVISLIY
jgi:hypothetical protein